MVFDSCYFTFYSKFRDTNLNRFSYISTAQNSSGFRSNFIEFSSSLPIPRKLSLDFNISSANSLIKFVVDIVCYFTFFLFFFAVIFRLISLMVKCS